jgi:hypothetical protein
VDSKFISEKWPQIVEHHKTITAAAVKQSRLKELECELQTPEARSVLLKLKERGELKKDICLSYTDIADQIFAEEDPAMWAMLLELYEQEVGENLLEPHSPPAPPEFAAVIDDLLYDPKKKKKKTLAMGASSPEFVDNHQRKHHTHSDVNSEDMFQVGAYQKPGRCLCTICLHKTLSAPGYLTI